MIYVGLSIVLKILIFFLYVVLIYVMKRKMKRNDNKILENGRKFIDEGNLEFVNNNGYFCVFFDEKNSEIFF